jgi:hypothetical protein
MADIDRDYPNRERTERTYNQSMSTGNSAGWWIAGLLVLAVLIIGFIAMSGGNPTPVEPGTTIENQVAPPVDGVAPAEPAPVETAPAEPAAPVEPAPAEPAPAEPAEPAPGG